MLPPSPPHPRRIISACVAAVLLTSGLAAAAPSDSVIVFNELMYHPAASDPAGEWVELYNQMAVDVDISGWRLSGGIDFEFPDGTVVGGGQFVVIAANPGALAGSLGPFTGALANGGETINLRDNSDRLMDSIGYGDSGAWPPGADGSGASLAKRSQRKPGADAANWGAGPALGGTPGRSNFPLPGEIETSLLLDWGASWRYNQSGSDLGAGWAAASHAPGGDWGQGAGPLGWDNTEPDIPIATRLTQPLLTPGLITYYFETDFTLSAARAAAATELQIVHMIDDGAVFYLNGVELGRFAMPGGAIGASTLASRGGDAEISEPLRVPPDALVAGSNRLSVEVHQNTTNGSDIVFGMQLLISQHPVSPSDLLAPLALNEVSSASDPGFQVELANLSGSPVVLDGFEIVSSSGGGYEFPGGSIAADGFLPLDTAQLGFRPASGDRLFLFSPGRAELIDARKVTNRLRGRAPGDDGGRWLYPSAPTFGAANTFSFNDGIVINEIMYHARPSFPSAGTPATYTDTIILPGSADWKYEQSGTFPGAAWMTGGYDDSGWPSGQAVLGVETSALAEPIRTGLVIGQAAYYFRTTFDYAGDPAVDQSRIRLLVDDGAIVYVNGTEALRWGMPDGAVDQDTLATTGVSNAVYQTFDLPQNTLVAGQNLIAVEVHQLSTNSSDIVFGMEVISGIQTDPGIAATPFSESAEEWVELYNRSGSAIDLGGWRLEEAIDFTFPAGTTLAPGAYLVIADDLAAFGAAHPGVPAIGGYSGGLGNSSDHIVLSDADGNPADEVHYFDGGRWDGGADGHGPSLELRNPDADNARGEAWQASDEAAKSTWKTYTFRAAATTPVPGTPTLWQDFAFGMLHGEGEVLLDDISVVEAPDGAAIERIQNGSFAGGSAAHWRLLGNHQRSAVEDDGSGNDVLHLVASGPTEYQGNQVETTFGGAAIANGAEYEFSFRARWLSGSSHLNSRLYFNRAPVTTELEVPGANGTPGARNSRYAANTGPTFDRLRHSPPLPGVGQPVTVTTAPSDPDGIAAATLHYRRDGGAWATVAMAADSQGKFSGAVPGQAAGSVVQFYVEARDGAGVTSTLPKSGAASRALYEVDDGVTGGGVVHDLRTTMLAADSDLLHLSGNSLSNELLGATVLYQDEAFYDVGIRLKGSFVGRDVARVGFNLKFNPDQLFRGVHGKVAIDRSTHADLGVDEILIKHIAVHAGDIPGMYDDLVQFIAPRSQHNQRALLRMAGFDDVYLDSQFDRGSDGTVYEYEVYRWSTATVDGNPESPKRVGPNGYLNIPFQDLGDAKDDYRWHCLISSNRTQDDYGAIIPFMKAFSLPAAELEAVAPEVMDVDAVLRTLAYQTLVGPADCTYTGGADHNFRLYARPDGKVMYLPWDWDSSFQRSTSAPLVGGGKLATLVNRPAHLRLYYGHLKDIIEKAFNTSYMSAWTSHYGALGGQNFSGRLSYIGARASYVLSQLPAQRPFTITTNSGNNFSVPTSAVTLAGDGWIDIGEIRASADGAALAVTWTDGDSWTLTIPLAAGANAITLIAVDRAGNQVGEDTITVTNTSPSEAASPTNLAVSEIMYHPAAGGVEFIEITNIGEKRIDLTGTHFTDGIDFSFANSAMLDPGARTVIAEDAAAFAAIYGPGVPVAGEFMNATGLSNAGERIVLVAGSGVPIRDFTYSDQLPWPDAPDGGGPSLVLIDPTSNPDHSLASSWRPSTLPGGNPGGSDATTFSGIAGDDADGNGIDDLLDYALGNAPGRRGAPLSATLSAGALELTYSESLAADDIVLTPQWSADLLTWSPLGEGFELSSLTSDAAGRQTRVLRSIPAIFDPGSQVFFRLAAGHPAP